MEPNSPAKAVAGTPGVWNPVSEAVPLCDSKKDSFGTQVLIWPPHSEGDGYCESRTAFYGRRVTNEPSFYLYGRVIYVTHWMALPKGPTP